MDLLKKEKRDWSIIQAIFSIVGGLIMVLMSYIIRETGSIRKDISDFEVLIVSGFIGFLIGLIILALWYFYIVTVGLKTPKKDKYVVIKHIECDEVYYTVNTIRLWWFNLIWELEAEEHDYDNDVRKFATEGGALARVIEKELVNREVSISEECEKNKTQEIVYPK